MHVERLLKLADLLEADAANATGVKFDLGLWAAPSAAAEEDNAKFDTKPDVVPVNCGTSACAMGLAVISGAFAHAGLYAHYTEETDDDCEVIGYTLAPAIMAQDRLYPRLGFHAAEALFDLDYSDVTYLFDPGNYDQTQGAEAELTVAGRIRDLTVGIRDMAHHPDRGDED